MAARGNLRCRSSRRAQEARGAETLERVCTDPWPVRPAMYSCLPIHFYGTLILHVFRRVWAANGCDGVVGHFLLHAEPAIVKDLWRIYEEGPARDQEHEVGTHVRVLFDDGLWYPGVLTEFKTLTKKYTVQFDDGDEMDLRIPDKDVEVVSREEASKKRPLGNEAEGGQRAAKASGHDDDGIMLGSNAYRYKKCDTAAPQQDDSTSTPCAPEDEAARQQREAEEAARAAAEERRRELAAQQRSTFVATSFRAPGPKKAAHEARKSGKKKKKKSGDIAKQGKAPMQKKYKFKNKSFK